MHIKARAAPPAGSSLRNQSVIGPTTATALADPGVRRRAQKHFANLRKITALKSQEINAILGMKIYFPSTFSMRSMGRRMSIFKLRIKGRLYFGFAVLLLLGMVLAVISLWQSAEVQGEVERMAALSDNLTRVLT